LEVRQLVLCHRLACRAFFRSAPQTGTPTFDSKRTKVRPKTRYQVFWKTEFAGSGHETAMPPRGG
jgi:hypothetical protein